jgi:dihydrofolate reductase
MLRANLSMSLDGFTAGPDQSVANPLGVGGTRVHEWAFPLAAFHRMLGRAGGIENASSRVMEEQFQGAGAVLMGRNMFGGQPGGWGDGAWRGWWGEDPPYHLPVFVVTHHPRAPLVMQGGTTFHFVTGGVEAALAQARAAAGTLDVHLSGGASLIRQCLAAGLIDQLDVSLAPVFLGRGERPFDVPAAAGLELEQVRVIEAPGVTHLRYRVVR